MNKFAHSSLNEHKKYSPFGVLISSNAFYQIKAAYIEPTGDAYELKAMLRVRSDFRWHWIHETFSDIQDAAELVEKLMDMHSANFPEHLDFLMFEKDRLEEESQSNSFAVDGYQYCFEDLV